MRLHLLVVTYYNANLTAPVLNLLFVISYIFIGHHGQINGPYIFCALCLLSATVLSHTADMSVCIALVKFRSGKLGYSPKTSLTEIKTKHGIGNIPPDFQNNQNVVEGQGLVAKHSYLLCSKTVHRSFIPVCFTVTVYYPVSYTE